MKLSRVIKEHNSKCFMKGRDNPWSGIIEKDFYGTFAANPKGKSTHHKWYAISCNDPNCPALKAVHSKVLKEA